MKKIVLIVLSVLLSFSVGLAANAEKPFKIAAIFRRPSRSPGTA